MAFLMKVIPIIFSFSIIASVFLFFNTIGNIFVSFLYKKIGDNSAYEGGYGDFNLFFNFNLIYFIGFLLTGFLIGFPMPPFAFDWAEDSFRYIQKIVFFCGRVFFHLFISSVSLFLGIAFFSKKFLLLIFQCFDLKINGLGVTVASQLLENRGPLLLLALFLVYAVVINLRFALWSFIFSISDYLFNLYANDIGQSLFLLFFFRFFAIFFLYYFFGYYILETMWFIITYPSLLFYAL